MLQYCKSFVSLFKFKTRKMNKTDILVTIDSVEKQQKAIEILQKYKQPTNKESDAFKISKEWKYLIYDKRSNWFIGSACLWQCSRAEITLDQLEEILKNENR